MQPIRSARHSISARSRLNSPARIDQDAQLAYRWYVGTAAPAKRTTEQPGGAQRNSPSERIGAQADRLRLPIFCACPARSVTVALALADGTRHSDAPRHRCEAHHRQGTVPMLTLGDAAKLSGMSKTSIRRSIDAGRISASKDEFGRWRIDPAELQRVYPDTGAPLARTVTPSEPGSANDAAMLRAELSAVREALDRERQVARDLAAERDAWRGQADAWRLQAAALLPPPKRERWFRHLFRIKSG